ncbi:hypothetical protein DY000_02001737 [Brassica cretica]|uniref:Uncharacterized protein n=1 Tax=Brassica cretica TaxID=69181 RepID=A0ABQ7CHL2_BRACR|nr:hypothetical protein DY000_02001737 [Brassica cretica]
MFGNARIEFGLLEDFEYSVILKHPDDVDTSRDSSDVHDGGETLFQAEKGNISAVVWWNKLSKCVKELAKCVLNLF